MSKNETPELSKTDKPGLCVKKWLGIVILMSIFWVYPAYCSGFIFYLAFAMVGEASLPAALISISFFTVIGLAVIWAISRFLLPQTHPRWKIGLVISGIFLINFILLIACFGYMLFGSIFGLIPGYGEYMRQAFMGLRTVEMASILIMGIWFIK